MNIIETQRLILRTWKAADLVPFSLINQDPLVMAFMPHILTIEESKAFINKMSAHYQKYGFGVLASTLKSTGELIGYIGLKNVEIESHFTPKVEIVWRIASQHWGKGLATEGAKACLEHGFNQLNLKEIVSLTVPSNISSIRVMEKIGMKRDRQGDFAHPLLDSEHRLSKHVLYRIHKA